MKYSPVVIPTLCRFEKFKNCVESLKSCAEAKFTELVIGFDYPPEEKYFDGWKKIKDYIGSISGFGKVTVFEQSANIGSSKNSLLLGNYAFENYGTCIYSEDDNIFSPYFLQFMNESLEKYEDDSSVVAVCGYSYPIQWNTDKQCVLQGQHFSAWGYGTWKDKNDKLRADLKNNFFATYFGTPEFYRMKRYSRASFFNFMSFAFDDEIRAFDIPRSFYMQLTSKRILMPVKTLVTNDGWDGSGEHCTENCVGIDFSNRDRNESSAVDVNSVEELFSYELEDIILSLKSKKERLKLYAVYFSIKLLGREKSRKLKDFLSRFK